MAFTDDLQMLIAEIKTFLHFGGDEDLDHLVDQIFDPFFGAPDPTAFDGPISTVYAGLAHIGSTGAAESGTPGGTGLTANPDLDKIGDVSDATLPWKGGTARTFRNNYAHPFPTITANQNRAALGVAHALKAEREIWVAVQKDVLDLAGKTVKAVASAESDSSGGDVLKAALTIGAAVIPLIGVEIATVDLVTAAVSLAASADTFDIGGDFPVLVLYQAMQQAERIKSGITEQEAKVKAAMDGLASAITDQEKLFLLPPPALVTQHGGLGEASY